MTWADALFSIHSAIGKLRKAATTFFTACHGGFCFALATALVTTSKWVTFGNPFASLHISSLILILHTHSQSPSHCGIS